MYQNRLQVIKSSIVKHKAFNTVPQIKSITELEYMMCAI